MSKRYTHTPLQHEAANHFLLQSKILGDPEFLERCHTLMQSTVIEAGMMVVSVILEISAARLTGASRQGKAGGEFVRHGHQPGAVYLGGSKVRLERPRVRSKSGEALAHAANDGLQALRVGCLVEMESIFRLRMEEASRLDVALLTDISVQGKGMALEWRVAQQDAYELVPVGVYPPRERRLARAIAASVLAHTPASCPDVEQDPVGFIQHVAVHGSALPPSVWEDIAFIGETENHLCSSSWIDYEAFTSLLGLADRQGFRPSSGLHWDTWPLYYAALDRETPHFWWDSCALRVRSLGEQDSRELVASLRTALADGMTLATRSVHEIVTSARRRRYLEALALAKPELVEKFLQSASLPLKWDVFRDGAVVFR